MFPPKSEKGRLLPWHAPDRRRAAYRFGWVGSKRFQAKFEGELGKLSFDLHTSALLFWFVLWELRQSRSQELIIDTSLRREPDGIGIHTESVVGTGRSLSTERCDTGTDHMLMGPVMYCFRGGRGRGVAA